MTKKREPTWGGRLPGGLAPEAWSFLHSLPHDRFLWSYDVRGTKAHVATLEAAGVVSSAQAKKLRRELDRIEGESSLIEEADEDVHSAIERVLTERLGDLGANVHAGRSRNDQVATALRLWVREAVGDVHAAVSSLVRVLADRAEETSDVLCPGYTHLQRAQPVTVGHWLCAHAWSFTRDLERLEAARRATDVSPLGAGALATSTLGLDPKVAAGELGFAGTFKNSIDAVSDRDFLADAAYACTMTLTHLSRLAEEVVVWSTSEFGYIRLPDAYATGSSMMPQKKNPDVAELARGQTGAAVGALTGLLVTLKGLPLAYDRDLQADKQHLHGLFETTAGAVSSVAGLMAHLSFDVDRLAAAAGDDSLLATDLAEALVERGVPFRKAHELVGELSKRAADAEVSLADVLERDPQALEPLEAKEAKALLDPRASLRRRTTAGGPSPRSVRTQTLALRRTIK